MGVVLVFHDVTEKRHRMRKHYRESEERFRQFFEDHLTGDFIASPDGQILLCNPAFVRTYGYASREQATRSNLRSLHLAPKDSTISQRIPEPFGSDREDNLITLCHECHAQSHLKS